MHQDVLHYLTWRYYMLFKKKCSFLQHPVQYLLLKLLCCSMSSTPCMQFCLFPSIKVFLYKHLCMSRVCKCAGSYSVVYLFSSSAVCLLLSHNNIKIYLTVSCLPLLYHKYIHSFNSHNKFNSSSSICLPQKLDQQGKAFKDTRH